MITLKWLNYLVNLSCFKIKTTNYSIWISNKIVTVKTKF